jgi:hypothetical protein
LACGVAGSNNVTIIQSRKDPFLPERDACCTVCGDRLYVPFVHWRGATDIFICSECAPGLRNGLTADLIHITAIKELQRLYHAYTLVREHTSTVDKKQEALANSMVLNPYKPF